MCLHGPNIVGRSVQMDATLLRYASVIMEQKTQLGVVAQQLATGCANRCNM